MHADVLVRGISQLVTAEGAGAKHGRAMRDLKVISDAALACAKGRFVWVGPAAEWTGDAAVVIDAGGRAVVPGLVDPHTHAMWAGNRLADFEARIAGASYESILEAGGGIRSTIHATAAASEEELVALTRPRVRALLLSGATTIELKSGYGFTPAAELAMLSAAQVVAKQTRAKIVPTLLVHIPPADDAERQAYIEAVCADLIPEVARRKLATSVDVFVEKEAWRADEAEIVFACARRHGLQAKLHTEQFHSVGGVELGMRIGALSVDHLEVCNPSQFAAIAGSETIATILPGVSLHLGIPAAPGRQLIDAGAAVAVGTDLNPGSSPLYSVATALALAVRLNGLTAQEALVAGTVNAAHAVGRPDAGRIEPGLPADLLILEGSDWRELVYTLGDNPVREVFVDGMRVKE
jgi:imidazolonepropionase